MHTPLPDTAGSPADSPVLRVLVVDDSHAQRLLLKTLLRGWGYDVATAASGLEALALCRQERFDLIVSDWIMPGMSGPDFCRAFRQLDGDSYCYFILLTAKTDTGAVAEGLDIGADDFLSKPVAPDELRARMKAGERLLEMERRLRDQNHQIASTLAELRELYSALDRDLRQARKLQQSLVRARDCHMDGAHLSLLLRPSGHVGGDMVGFFPIGEGRLGFYAFDVSGHGVTSALMCARLAGLFSGGAGGQNIALGGAPDDPVVHPPDLVAERMNRLLLSEMDTEHYCTLCYAEADLQTGQVRFVQAGHPHPLVQRADGDIDFLGTGGLPIGLFSEARFESTTIHLRPGDRLLIYSDGITENADPRGAELGEPGLRRIVQRLHGLRGHALMDAMLWDLAQWGGSDEFGDDVSAVLFEYDHPPD